MVEEQGINGPQLFGLIGHPVSHSAGQMIFNTLFEDLGIDALYLSMDVHSSSLEKTVSGLKRKFLGFNVTIPHKVAVMEFLDDFDSSAVSANNVNLAVSRNGKLSGFNTDYTALTGALKGKLSGEGVENALIFGTGGTCRTTMAVLRDLYGTERITLVSRDPDNARSRFSTLPLEGIDIIGYDDVGKLHDIDAIFNCSPAGMEGFPEKTLPLPRSVREMPLILDFVYTPVDTGLISWAHEHGTKVISGDEIYIRQAIDTLAVSFGKEAGMEQMKRHFDEWAGNVVQ